MARDDKFIRLALNIAQLSTHPKFKLGAIITKGSNILSVGVNKFKTHPRQDNPYTKQKARSIHAELSAILGLSKEQLQGSTIYVARILSNNSQGLAKPCNICRDLIEEAGIKRIVWTTSDKYKSERL